MSERRRRIGHFLLQAFGIVFMLGAIALTVAPLFIHLDTYGIHDWDQMEAHRYLAVKTIKRFHEIPFWNPYSCGGHTWWGGIESGSTLISPALPLYLFAPFPWALRLEVILATLLSAVGTWLLAGRFTKSAGLRLIAVATFTLDSRYTLQASMGHAWHLYYAWTPWALYFLDRAIGMAPRLEPQDRFPLRDVILLGATLAMMVYTGGIYPLPHTIAVLAVYALVCAAISRSARPITRAAVGGLLSFAFSAPRLLPLMDMLRRYPRLVDSTESLDLTSFIAVFTAREGDPHPPVAQWGWHEYGIYTGWLPFVLILLGLAFARRARERALQAAGALCLVLGFGRFHKFAPWALAHDYLPIFESQHVPSRWLYPAALLLILAAISVVERLLRRQTRRGLLEVAVLFVGAYVAADIALEAQRPLVGSFVRHMQSLEDRVGEFHQERAAPPSLRYDISDWAPPNMPAMVANVGVLECNTFPGFNSYYRDKQDHTPGLGAIPRGDPRYRGEAFTASGNGFVDVTDWSPNAVTVAVRGGRPGDLVVMNQNWDPGWRANGAAVVDYRDTIAAPLHASDEVITFRFVPRFLGTGCLILLCAVAALVWVSRARRPVL